MCLRPILVKNKGFDPKDPLSRKYISVPCGHCAHCIQQAQMSLTFRATREMEFTIGQGGFASFVTLTYAPKYLPVVYHTYQGKERSLSTWCFDDIDRYFKRIRSKLPPGATMRYLLTCERGSRDSYTDDKGNIRKATWRPHYHIIFYVTGCDEHTFNKIVHEQWRYGMLRFDTIDRDPVHAIGYVVKYAYKHYGDVSFHIDPKNINRFKVTPFEVTKGRKDCRKATSMDMCPRTLQSNFIGLSFLDSLKGLTFDAALDYMLFTAPVDQSTGKPISIPRYYFKLGNGNYIQERYPDTYYLFKLYNELDKFITYEVPTFIYHSSKGLIPKYRINDRVIPFREVPFLPLEYAHFPFALCGPFDTKVHTKSETVPTVLGYSYVAKSFGLTYDYYKNAMRYFCTRTGEFSLPVEQYAHAPFFKRLCQLDKDGNIVKYPDGYVKYQQLSQCDLQDYWSEYGVKFDTEYYKYYRDPLGSEVKGSLFREIMDCINFVQKFRACERMYNNEHKYESNLFKQMSERPHLFEPVDVTEFADVVPFFHVVD